MKSTLQRRLALDIFLITCLLILLFSCKKNETATATQTPPLDLSTTVSASVSGFVTDENDAPVTAADVHYGTLTGTTDKYGYFEIKNATVVQNAAVVTITKPGYFKGIKSFTTDAGKEPFCRIKLIPKTITGTINATSGGSVILSNGLSVTLPENAVVNATTKAAYTGTVNVSSFWIDPTNQDMGRLMPGDLRGFNTTGDIKALQSYGMAAVELTGSAGELLQIAGDKKATLTMTIPASILADAPASIPLWYFDETKGYWKEEGSATKTGNTYIGQVSHFSYWNCDIPFANSVKFTATILSESGHPLANTNVNIYYSNNQLPVDSAFNGYTGCHGYTDENGYISGLIPANTQLILKAFTNNYCGNSLSSSYNFSTTNENIALGNITIANIKEAIVTGTVVNCNNQPVTNGYIIVNNGYTTRYPVSNTGSFSFSTILCNNNTPVTIFAEDADALQQSDPSNTMILIYGNNNAGTLKACSASISQFINYTLDGNNYSLSYPADGLYESINSGTLYINGYTSTQDNYKYVNFSLTNQNIGTGSTQDLLQFSSTQLTDSLLSSGSNVKVNITEYGSIGEYISGNFAGTLTGQAPANKTYNVTCNFRVKRSQ